jgi:hypothetical protein
MDDQLKKIQIFLLCGVWEDLMTSFQVQKSYNLEWIENLS